jgi:hypothetical protein
VSATPSPPCMRDPPAWRGGVSFIAVGARLFMIRSAVSEEAKAMVWDVVEAEHTPTVRVGSCREFREEGTALRVFMKRDRVIPGMHIRPASMDRQTWLRGVGGSHLRYVGSSNPCWRAPMPS